MTQEIEERPLLELKEVEREFCCHFSPEFTYRRIRFEGGAEARYGSIVGFIMGMKLAGKVDEAAQMAKHFKDTFKRLNEYGGETEVQYDHATVKVPMYRISLIDDGCAHSFCIVWYSNPEVVPYGTTKEEPKTLLHGVFPTLRYRFSFNGGLIFHGFNNETYSVRIGNDSNPWSIHT